MQPLKNQRGQSLIEYVILVALVGVASMKFVRILQDTINVNIVRVTNSLQGVDHKPPYKRVSDDELVKRGFNDFMNGAASRDNNERN